MIIDKKSRMWILSTAAIGVAAAIAYMISARLSVGGSRGGSVTGLVFGSACGALFVFECLLSLRKKFRASLLGRVQTWLRAHIWFGFLAVPLAFMHSGMRWGSGLAAALMCLLLIVALSGMAGLMFQHYIPRRMKELVERETIREQIPQAIADLRLDADRRVESHLGDLTEVKDAMYVWKARVAVSADGHHELRTEYLGTIRPWLTDRPAPGCVARFRTRAKIRDYFLQLAAPLPPPVRETLADLEEICEERRQLDVQRGLHVWLHGWLLVHVPISFALLLLTAAHAVLALRY